MLETTQFAALTRTDRDHSPVALVALTPLFPGIVLRNPEFDRVILVTNNQGESTRL